MLTATAATQAQNFDAFHLEGQGRQSGKFFHWLLRNMFGVDG